MTIIVHFIFQSFFTYLSNAIFALIAYNNVSSIYFFFPIISSAFP